MQQQVKKNRMKRAQADAEMRHAVEEGRHGKTNGHSSQRHAGRQAENNVQGMRHNRKYTETEQMNRHGRTKPQLQGEEPY